MLLLVPSTWQAQKPCPLRLAGNGLARGHGQGAKQTHPGALHSNCNCAAVEARTAELQGNSGVEQWLAAAAVQTTGDREWGGGGAETRQVVAFIFSTPGRAHY